MQSLLSSTPHTQPNMYQMLHANIQNYHSILFAKLQELLFYLIYGLL